MVTQNMSATFVRRNDANKIMNFGENEPSRLPSLNALRVMKYKSKIKNQLHHDPIMALSLLKCAVPYNKIIKDIGYDRFFVHYWAVTELNMYRLYAKQNYAPRITIDATGGLVSKCRLISGRETSSIFLYQIGVMDYKNKSQFTVAHMLSERHDNNSISHWLTEWVKNITHLPKIVVTDQSKALMMAVVKSFTQYSSLYKYLNVCSSLILKKSGVEIPNCMLRNDFNHTMKLLSCWPEIKNCTYRIKNFYLRSIGLIIASTDFNDIKYLLQCIFMVALNEEDGYNSENVTNICENAKQYLKQRIATHDIVIDDNININGGNMDNQSSELDSLLQELNDEDCIINIINDIYENCLRKSQSSINHGNHDNMQYSPMIAYDER